jgi:predicted nucleic acid-binding protein
MHLVDTSALIALLTDEDTAGWVEETFNARRQLGGVFINQIAYSELCALFDSEAEASAALRDIVERADLNWNCAFPAGTAYRLYKTRGGRKPRMLADFLIAAHAHSLGWSLITHDPGDVRSYFPRLQLIFPPDR